MTTSAPDARTRAIACAVLATVLFGTIGTARVLGPEASAPTVGAARLAVAATLLVALALHDVGGRGLTAAGRVPASWIAGGCQVAFQLTFLAAVELTGVAVGTLLAIGTAPIWSGLLARHVTRAWAGATGLAVCGLVLLVLGGGATFSGRGAALALGAGLSYAAYTAATGAAARRGVPPSAATAAPFLIAAVLLSPALLLGDLGWLPTPEGVALVAYLSVVPTVVAYLLFAVALRSLAAPTVQTLGLTEPVVATLLGVLVLGERIDAVGVGGVVLVLLGLLVLGRATVGSAEPVRTRQSPS